MTSEGKTALLPANVDQRPPLQRGLMNFQLYKKTRISMFSSVSPRKTLRFQENKIVCFPLDQSLRIYYSLWMECLLTAGQPKSCISPAHVKTWSERKNVNFTRDNFVWRHVQDLQGYSQAPGFDRATLNRIRSVPIRSCMGESLLIPSLLVNCTLSSLAKCPNQCCKLSLKSPEGSGY